VVVTTRGEAGSWDENRWSPADMGTLRTKEMEASLAVLGVSEHYWLDYVDGTCETVEDAEGTAKVAAIIADVQPDTVLTFGPDGRTGHPDHLAVHRWTTMAFEASAPSGAGLHYSVLPSGPIEEHFPGRARLTCSTRTLRSWCRRTNSPSTSRSRTRPHATKAEGPGGARQPIRASRRKPSQARRPHGPFQRARDLRTGGNQALTTQSVRFA
jgi:LmbE family N-acetylglucosaminyl deacetylase